MQSNVDKLIAVSVMGHIASPSFPGLPAEPYRLDADGVPFLLPTYGSIVYNVSVGDSVYGWLADCVHPSVSISLPQEAANHGLNFLACVGNPAVVMSGMAKGSQGIVTGKSGRFSEHVIVHFPKATREKMAIGDRILVRSQGVGLKLESHSKVTFKSCSPALLTALESQGLRSLDDGRLSVPVVAVVPSYLVGAGAGLTSEGGSIHIQTVDKEALQEAGLGDLKLGDLVALQDYDSRYQHGHMRKAVGIGVVGQGDSPRAGYGPGVTLLMTATDGAIVPEIKPAVNLTTLLDIPA